MDKSSKYPSSFKITDLIEVFSSNDLNNLDAFFIKNGLSLSNISKLNNSGKEVETGEVISIHQWKPKNDNDYYKFNYINFNKWEGKDANSLDIQFREELFFFDLLNQVLLLEDYERYFPRFLNKSEKKYYLFFNSKKSINIQFINNNAEHLLFKAKVYGVVITRFKLDQLITPRNS